VAPDAAARDALRSQLLAKLSQRFGEARLGSTAAEAPTFA
jgi:hypothetical protein